jgi:single-stranded-DNA-specific exonuclease
MPIWLDPPTVEPTPKLNALVGGHPLVATILARRGITDPTEALAFLHPDHYTPAPPDALPGVTEAAEHLLSAIQKGDRILVWGDFDVDGQTSTALLVDALRGLGCQVDYYIPHRLTEGHGIFPKSLKPKLEGINVLLTCDVGVSAHDAIHMAGVLGVTTLITDHHALPPTLPEADAIVNPQLVSKDHPLRDLPGVGVAYMLIEHLYTLAGRPDEATRYLDLVALGIVADVARQRADTRYLLQRGLEGLRDPQRAGIEALIQSSGVDATNLSAGHIGFQLGPRLNALGRLSDANAAVELLTTTDVGQARILAAELEGLNNKRKQMSDQTYAAAQETIARDPSLLDFEALVLSHPRWHPGIIGIVASRLVDLFERPVILLTASEGQIARGSARSVPGVDIGACIAAQADLLIQHGGHPGAAGLSLDADLLPQFRRRLSNTIAETRTDDVAGLQLDAEVSLADLTVELADDLERLAPFGEGNPPIHFVARDLTIEADIVMGVNNRHRRLTVQDESGAAHQAVWWFGADHDLPGTRFDLVFTPRINDFRGRRSLQLEWVEARTIAREISVAEEGVPQIGITDLRATPDPLVALRDFLQGDLASIWVEALEDQSALETLGDIGTRADLAPGPTLVIWTTPPGPHELARELEWPAHVVVVGQHSPPYTPESFLKRLFGLAKYALRAYDGEVSIEELAGATGQRNVTVRRGLEWLEAKGQLTLEEWLDGETVRLGPGGQGDSEALEPLQDALSALLAEAAAYRVYFQRASLDALFKTS